MAARRKVPPAEAETAAARPPPDVETMAKALGEFIEARDVAHRANAAERVAREALVAVLTEYGLSGYVP